jgi:peptidoglycan/LPS O-acetylase OafA/YrhL
VTVRDVASADYNLRPPELQAGTAPEDRRFRPDVQGLRAVAVVLVILFHAHISGFSGGYIGVDVFFVISGFVITGVLLREKATAGSTSLVSFYGRRARRIIPMATLVIVIAIVASYQFLGPVSGDQTATDGIWASIFLVNVHFAANGTNYLASQLPPSVLQNYWSLAVEEQFYLVYPTIFLALGRLSWRLSLRRRLGIVLAVAAVASFIISIVQTSADPTTAYFSPLPRVWELALGGLVAVCTVELRRTPTRIAAALSWLGLAFVLAAAHFYTSATAYPGWAVALPVIGAALIIGGGVAQPPFGVERLLGLRPIQWIGLISYSWYLWHWPVLTIATEWKGTGSLPTADALGWVFLSLVLAVITYLVVENPIRRSRFLITRRWASLVLGGCLIASSLTVAGLELHGHPRGALAVPDLGGLKNNSTCPPPTKGQLASLMGTGSPASQRTVARVMLVGDSTACTMLPGLEAVGAPDGVQIADAAVIGCGVVSGEIAPLYLNGANVYSGSKYCQARAIALETRALRIERPNIVLWASSWERMALVVGVGAHQKVLTQGSPQWRAVLMQRIKSRVQLFTAAGAKVVMLTQPPFASNGHPTRPSAADADFVRLNALLTQFAQHQPHVTLINLSALVCPTGPPCPQITDGLGYRTDGAHYSADGSLAVARWLLPQLGISDLHPSTQPLPMMTMVVPRDGMSVKGMQYVLATAPYHFGVSKVEFRLTGGPLHNQLIATTDFTTEWNFMWNTTTVPNGSYKLHCVAFDAGGQHVNSKDITVRVAN